MSATPCNAQSAASHPQRQGLGKPGDSYQSRKILGFGIHQSLASVGRSVRPVMLDHKCSTGYRDGCGGLIYRAAQSVE
jgi:hypothetical protein